MQAVAAEFLGYTGEFCCFEKESLNSLLGSFSFKTSLSFAVSTI
jgi:hypothetical protein